MGVNKKFSFTLIEIVIVIGIISSILPVIFSVVFVILREQIKLVRLQEIKRQADFALNSVKETIKNSAISLYDSLPPDNNPICLSDSSYSNPYFLDKNGNYFWFFLSDSKISSGSSVSSSIDITDNKVIISNYLLTCERKNFYSPPLINISFDIGFNSSSNRPEEIIPTLHYQTKFKLKTY